MTAPQLPCLGSQKVVLGPSVLVFHLQGSEMGLPTGVQRGVGSGTHPQPGAGPGRGGTGGLDLKPVRSSGQHLGLECGLGLILNRHWICCLSRNSERKAQRPARKLSSWGKSAPRRRLGRERGRKRRKLHFSYIARHTFQCTEMHRDRCSRWQGEKCHLSFSEGPAVLFAWASPGCSTRRPAPSDPQARANWDGWSPTSDGLHE